MNAESEGLLAGLIDPSLGPKILELVTEYGLTTIGALVVLIAAWILSGWARKATRTLMSRTHADGTLSTFVATIARWAVIIAGIVISLGVFGVETTSLAAVLGGAGVGIGVALQGNLANLASGLLLVAFRPFAENDWIELEDSDVDGRITRIGLVFTELDTFQNDRVTLPNQLLFDQPVTNHDKHDVRRVDVSVGVSYDTDLKLADKVLNEVAERTQAASGAGSHREPKVWWTGFGASSIDAKVCVWTPTADSFVTKNRLILAIKEAFDEAGIEIPFPQRDLHLKEPAASQLQDMLAAK